MCVHVCVCVCVCVYAHAHMRVCTYIHHITSVPGCFDFFFALNFSDANGLHTVTNMTTLGIYKGYWLPGWLVYWMKPTTVVLIVVSKVYPQATILTE